MVDTKIVKTSLNLELAMAVWWDFAWKTTLVSVIIGMVLGFMVGLISTMFGDENVAGALAGTVAWLVTIPVGIFMLKRSLSRDYGNYSIMIVKKEEPKELEVTLEAVEPSKD